MADRGGFMQNHAGISAISIAESGNALRRGFNSMSLVRKSPRPGPGRNVLWRIFITGLLD
jgi:hypothetical protein